MAEITALSMAAIMLLLTRQFVGLSALVESAAALCVRQLHAVCLGIHSKEHHLLNQLLGGMSRLRFFS